MDGKYQNFVRGLHDSLLLPYCHHNNVNQGEDNAEEHEIWGIKVMKGDKNNDDDCSKAIHYRNAEYDLSIYQFLEP